MTKVVETARLYAILAREADVGVVFRRGPSKQVMLAKWNTSDDTFELGQWLKGRIYERDCDLSPCGKYLIYSAGTQKSDYFYTAISKPPYLTALGFWPHYRGEGGGIFESSQNILLNHDWPFRKLDDRGNLPEGFSLSPLPRFVPYRDQVAWQARLARDGWIGKLPNCQKANGSLVLRMAVFAQKGAETNPVASRFWIENEASETCFSPGILDWADWDKNGDLLFADRGKLFRLNHLHVEAGDQVHAKQLIDFVPYQFEAIESPDEAKQW